MPVKPKFEIEDLRKRTFTDRRTPVNLFLKALDDKKLDLNKQIVLNFYGVGGMGKTSLNKHLRDLMKNLYEKSIIASLNFEHKDPWDPIAALDKLRWDFSQTYGMNTFHYDTARHIYERAFSPHRPMKVEDLPFFEENSVIATIFEYGSILPDAEKYLKFIQEAIKRGKQIGDRLSRKNLSYLEDYSKLDARKMISYLPQFFAMDVHNLLSKNQIPVTIFIDTHEAIWSSNRTQGNMLIKDDWLQELVTHLPEATYIICGRDPLRWMELDKGWNDVIIPFKLEAFKDRDSKEFLRYCDIQDENINEFILNICDGLPYLLDKYVIEYEKLSKSRNVTIEAFTDRLSKIDLKAKAIDRFYLYLNDEEKHAFNILSIPDQWDQELFAELMKRFNHGFPTAQYDNLNRYSIVMNGEMPGYYSIDRVMRSFILEKLNQSKPGLITEIRQFLFQYYEKRIMNPSGDIQDKTPILREISNILTTYEYQQWINKINTLQTPFVGRIQELSVIDHYLGLPIYKGIYVKGVPGVGKTTLLHMVMNQIKQKEINWIPIFIHAHDIQGPEHLLRWITKIVIHEVKDEFDSLLEIKSIGYWVSKLSEILNDSEITFVFIIDGLDEIDPKSNQAILQLLSELFSLTESHQVRWVISAREFSSHWSPQDFKIMNLDVLNNDELVLLITNQLKSSGIYLSKDEIEEVVMRSGGSPFAARMAAYYEWNRQSKIYTDEYL
ncbi:NACHT domain-containing protein [Paenibacillus aceris]|uniref:Cdc6-like AAA superfamily ATPase/energy-coupling factor transporter ATP-binding protein EcfA2 n=1 Tax=Paenibacillus aceris TaxID=869555 RepID=A0ABS4HS38_9BACL|nr:ATP-binding protein [Paenibacillus aceris]MBP1960834.1 Cdc6-like AAA superfamily ATPase/energy-coupling factor transporter ATP-binding protein EcfA2 [Paenibacillus aceris]NHW35489.1 ATP-binding protein [Paenibacillus aceris]